MKKEDIREQGLVGTLFTPKNPHAAVMVLAGSRGGIPETRAEALAEQGFCVLALAYFGVDPLPKRLQRVPLEYFETALDFLKNRSEKIGVWGTSRGAELALILGTLFPKKIDAIAAHVPSSVIYGAFEDLSIPAWLYRGKTLAPSAPFRFTASSTGANQESAIQTTPCFLKSMSDSMAFAVSAICVEKLRCPLLLISAGDDQMWPSGVFAEQIVARLKAYGSSISVKHLHYPDVGHAPSTGAAGLHLVWQKWFSYGGKPEDNAHAAIDWVDQTLAFFQRQFTA